ncbi:MAG: DUF3078 domain-containing protein [Bacteroidota bacterium]|nr:DUF3078 domain-containing protein [Bacteroidota bacterium]
MKSPLLVAVFLMGASIMFGQTQEELLAQKVAKEAELAIIDPQLKELTAKAEALRADIAVLAEQTTPYPRWDVGTLGNVGLGFSSFSDWLSKSSPNTTAFNIGVSTNAFANLQQRKYFWRNNANLTLGWLKFNDRDDPTDNKEFRVAADAFNATTLLGYKLSEKLAISTLGEYRTAILEDKLNDPGYLDVGAGVTWTPIVDLVVVVHPLNYNFIFSRGAFDYQSSLGAKVVADYKKEITKGLAWRSNLSAFYSYDGIDLSNWTWVNGFSTARKGIGLGLDFGLRGNKQEALASGRTDNPIQSYWIVGLSFAL